MRSLKWRNPFPCRWPAWVTKSKWHPACPQIVGLLRGAGGREAWMGLRWTCDAGGHLCPIKGLRGVVGEVGVQVWLGHVHETHIIRKVSK